MESEMRRGKGQDRTKPQIIMRQPNVSGVIRLRQLNIQPCHALAKRRRPEAQKGYVTFLANIGSRRSDSDISSDCQIPLKMRCTGAAMLVERKH